MSPLEFETLHEPRWRELERLVDKTDRDLDPERFLQLYRGCCEHLALAQARGFPAHVVDRLASVTARAHQIVYRTRDYGLARIRNTLLVTFPCSVRENRGYMWAAAALFAVPTIAIGVAVYFDPELVLSIVDGATVSQFDHMYGPASESIGRMRDAGNDSTMFGFYIMNNIGIAFQCYVTGIVFGLGSLFFLLWNGVFGGAIAGFVVSRGYGLTFFSFVVTHSAFELTAIVLSGGAGLKIGRSLLLPGRLPRLLSIERAARETSSIVFGAAVMLLLAAAIEAYWSSAVWVAPPAKFACAAACWSLVGLFFARRPRAA
jgi:uncharacterized membrane protein SpoIIM required for sporulation